MKALYFLFVRSFRLGISLAALWNQKAKQWIEGRKNTFDFLEKNISAQDKVIWMHCASAGEFEQGKPILEGLKTIYPNHKLLVSFFSPSGFSVGKKYKSADLVVYLPLDTKQNAERFLRSVHPSLVVFVKYDYWYHHLKAVADKKIPLLMVSALFRPESIFFKWYGGFHRSMLHFFTQIFVQDEVSEKQLKQIGFKNCLVSGDTRFDRVISIAEKAGLLEDIHHFCNNKKVIVAGSTWPEDEALFVELVRSQLGLKFIMAPHEINPTHIKQLQQHFPQAALYSQWNKKDPCQILIIDNIGMLSRLYQYASICYIGGGFNKSGIHNTLEAAVWGKPVLFGPNYQKFREARDLVACGAANSVQTKEELVATINDLLFNENKMLVAGQQAFNYVRSNQGATDIILNYIQENRLLTMA